MELIHDDSKKKNKGELAVGFDLTNTYSQISYCYTEEGSEPETLSPVAGGHSFMIPTLLFKRREVNQWYAGKEAEKNSDQDGFMLKDLVSLAHDNEEIQVGEDKFRPESLLALYMKRTLSLINIVAPVTRIDCFMVTVEDLDDRMISLLSEAVSMLGLKTDKIFFQSHMESFYFYSIFQPKELWLRQVLLLDFSTNCLRTFRMECNNNTTPVVAFIDPVVFPNFNTEEVADLLPDTAAANLKDNELSNIINELTEKRMFSSIFFIGENFNKDIYRNSLRKLAGMGRLFEGNNLYSKGATYSARNKLCPAQVSSDYVFLGNDKLKFNVGINVLKQGQSSYMAVLDAGINWFEATKECELILNQGNRISFVITPLTGKNPAIVDITLGDLPKRPPKTTRLHLSIKMLSESRMQVNVRDMGFGELFPATDVEWNEVIEI